MLRIRHIQPPDHPRNPRILLISLCLLVVLQASPAAAMPKTDVITLINGDIITCEIKEMVRGKLRAKTDHMGTVSLEWDKITHVTSNYWFLITTKDGSLTYGQMTESTEDGFLTVDFQERSVSLPMASVVEIHPVRYEFWDRIDISLAFGFNWSKGTQVFQSNFDTSAKYKGRIYSYGLDAEAMSTEQGNDEITRRNQLDLWLEREVNGRWHTTVQAGTFRNDELGVRMRVSGGLNLGYYIFRLPHLELRGLGGANVNREWASGEVDATNNTEGRAGFDFSLFYYDTPKSDISVKADLYPSFTVRDRYRFEGNISARQEIIKDLFIKLEYYESRDTKPPAGANAKSDRGIVFSIEWTK